MLAILTSRTRILCAYNSTCQAISLAARTRFCRLYKPAGFTLFALNGTAIALIFCGWANYIDLARFFLSSVESTMPLEMQLMSDCPTGYTRRLNSSTFCEFAVLSSHRICHVNGNFGGFYDPPRLAFRPCQETRSLAIVVGSNDSSWTLIHGSGYRARISCGHHISICLVSG